GMPSGDTARVLIKIQNELSRSPDASGRGINTENGFSLCHSGLSRIFLYDSGQTGGRMTEKEAGITMRNDNYLYPEAELRGILD
ncbi:MAG: hypothetical protein U0937_02805, partial [Thermodesulfovibrionia bacterium]|nr:hypothetical protein [Thermodesulfovibrionia bacterium]